LTNDEKINYVPTSGMKYTIAIPFQVLSVSSYENVSQKQPTPLPPARVLSHSIFLVGMLEMF
jgi:hypothetical protein